MSHLNPPPQKWPPPDLFFLHFAKSVRKTSNWVFIFCTWSYVFSTPDQMRIVGAHESTPYYQVWKIMIKLWNRIVSCGYWKKPGIFFDFFWLFDHSTTQANGSNLPNEPFGTPYGPFPIGPRPQNVCGNVFGRPIWSPRPIFDLSGPRKMFRILTEKVGFLTVCLHRRAAGQTGHLENPFGPF